MDAALTRFDDYTSRLAAWAASDARVCGLVLLGSGVDRRRIDEWSDHDIAVVVHSDRVGELRATTDWIPDADSLVSVGREWHDGFKALFRDGRVIEYAVTDREGLASFPISAAHIVYDAGDVLDVVERARRATTGSPTSAAPALAAVLLVQLIVGVGRLRRGERLSGGDVVRSEAVKTLIALLFAVRHADSPRPDPFDVRRRFEQVDAAAAARLDAELAGPPETAARGILDIAEELLADDWPDWPREGAAAVRRRLGWVSH